LTTDDSFEHSAICPDRREPIVADASAVEGDTGAPKGPGGIAVGVIVACCIALLIVLIYALCELWPTAGILKKSSAQPVHFLGLERKVSPDVRLLLLVAVAGALGGLMHSTRSLAWYVGHQGLRWRWVPYYVVTVFIGAGLATVFYLVFRGGMLGTTAKTSDTNPYGFAALGALVGLFTEQALQMLKKVADQVFTDPPRGADAVAGQPAAQKPPDGSPSAVKTGPASSITAVSAILEGDLPIEGSASYRFDYGTTSDYGQTTTTQAAGPDTHVKATITGLSPATLYHFQLVALDEGGQPTTGGDLTFSTAGS
jgi:hypothetical protein